MLPSFNETKYNSHWQLCSLEELGRGKSKHRPRDDNRLFSGEYPFMLKPRTPVTSVVG